MSGELLRGDYWNVKKTSYYHRPSSVLTDNLPIGNYSVEYSSLTREYFLKEKKIKPISKIYGFDEEFISRCLSTYEQTSRNLGILLYGLKGTGKSVCATQICARSNLPIIIINDASSEVLKFISDINQDIVILIDEYEKVFAKNPNMLLGVMDGALDTNYRRLFILTSNTINITEYMLERPGRIRYIRKYDNLSKEITIEIVRDIIGNDEDVSKIVNFIGTLQTITVDIVKSVSTEYKLHKCDLEKLPDYLNIKVTPNKYNIKFVRGYSFKSGVNKDNFDVGVMCNQSTWLDDIDSIENIHSYNPTVTELNDLSIYFRIGTNLSKGSKNISGRIILFNDTSVFLFTEEFKYDNNDNCTRIYIISEYNYTKLPVVNKNW